ncbi:hypothetical protein D3C87_2035470 [compost metagenome]
MLLKIDSGDPAIFDILEPLFIIAVFGRMEVQDVFSDKNKFIYSLVDHEFQDLSFQQHNVIPDRIIPFSDKLDDGIIPVVIRIQNFKV